MKKLLTLTLFITILLSALCSLQTAAQVNGDYQTINSGNFTDNTIWQVYNSGWGPAGAAPTGTGSITIQAAHTITMNAGVVMSASKIFTINGTIVFTGAQQIDGVGSTVVNLNAGSFFKTANANGFWGTSGSIKNNIFNVNVSNTSTIEFNAAGPQTSGFFVAVGNVTVNLSGGNTLSAFGATINGTLYMQSGIFFGSGGITLSNPITGTVNNFTLATSATLTFAAATTAGCFIPSSVTSIANLQLMNTSNTVLQNGNLTVQSLYTSGGKVNTNGNYMHITVQVVNSLASSFVIGRVRRTISSTTGYLFPLGNTTGQDLTINTGGTLSTILEAESFEAQPIGTVDAATCNGTMLNRYYNLKVIGANNLTASTNVSFRVISSAPTLTSSCRVAASLNNSAGSFNGLGGKVSLDIINSTRNFNAAHMADLSSGDGLFLGIASLPGIPMAAGKYCIGPAANYTPPSGAAYINASTPYVSMKAALLDLNDLGVAGNSIFELQNDYLGSIEELPVRIYYQGTVTTQAEFRIREDFSGTHAIGGYMDGPNYINAIINMDNCSYVTINGTKNNTPGTRGLRIYNNCTASCTPLAITINNDAMHNTIIGCSLEALNSCVTSSTMTGVTGSDFTTIQYCKFKQYTGVNGFTFGYHVYESGLSTCKVNDVKILDCEFENIARPIIAQTAINGNWEFSRNHIYTTFTNPGMYYPITILMNDPGSVMVENNYIGGSAPYAQGARAPVYNGAPLINVRVRGTSINRFSGNTIRNIRPNATGTVQIMEILANSSCQMNNNLLGDSTVANSLDFLATEPTDLIFIRYTNDGSGTINTQMDSNMVSNVRFQNTAHTGTHQLFRLNDNLNGTGTFTVDGNTIRNITDAGNTGFAGFYFFTSTTARTLTLSRNVIESISRPLTGAGAQNFHGFNVTNIATTLNGNRIGKWNTPNDIVFGTPNQNFCFFASLSGSQQIQCNNDTIANVNFTNTGTNSTNAGIYLSAGSGSHIINNNVIRNLSTATTRILGEGNGIPGGYSLPLTGITYYAVGSNGQVNNNTIDGLNATSTAVTNVGVMGIAMEGGNASLSGNKIYNLTNSSAGTVTQPFIAGIRLLSNTTFTANNNMVSINNGANTNAVRLYGLLGVGSGTYVANFNTITIRGSSGGAARSAAFWKTTLGNYNLRNNILHNNRTGGTLNYAMVNENGTGTGSGWTYSSNYNNIYSSNPATVGAWPLANNKTFALWQALSGDANSKNTDVRFVNPSSDLHMAVNTNCNLDNEGTNVAGITTDIDGQTRHAITPSIGADEFTYDPNWASVTSNSIICSPPQSLDFITTDNTYGAHTYQWSGPNGFASTAVPLSISNPTDALHSGTYTLTITDVLSCAATPVTTSATVYEPAVISFCPGNVTQSNDAGLCTSVINYPTAIATGVPAPVIYYSHPSGSAFPVGTTTVTVSAVNYCDSVTCTFTVTVADTSKPLINNCPANISLNTDAGNCTAIATWTAPTASDNCSVLSFTSSHTSGATFPVGTTTVTYTATDVYGNSESCSFNVTVTDNEKPVFVSCPANISKSNDVGNCSAIVTWVAPSATDNCSLQPVTSTHTSGNTFAVGTTTVTYYATDVYGNIDSCWFNVTVTDTSKPVIGCPANILVSNDAGNCSAVVAWTAPSATDNCAVQSTVSSHNSGDTFSEGVTTVTYTVTDIHGNIQTCSFTVSVSDGEAPTFSNCPANITVNNSTGNCFANVSWIAPTASDNCALNGVPQSSHNSGAAFPIGTTTVTYTAEDMKGNTGTCSFNVTVVDNELPTITCPAVINTCNTSPALGSPVTADNCNVDTVYNDAPVVFSIGTTTVTWTVEDINGNINTCTQNVTIQNPSVAATGILSTSGNNICIGGNTLLSTDGGVLGAFDTWQWYSGSCGGVSAGSGTSITVSPTTTTTYYVRAEGPCGNTLCAVITISVSTSPLAANVVVPVNNLPVYACNGTAVSNLNVSAVTGATQYIWDGPTGTTFNGGANPYTSAAPSASIVFGNPNGSGYYIGVQAANACGTTVRKTQWVRGTVGVPANITPQSGLTTYCANTGPFTFSCPAVTGATQYLWTITGDAVVSGTGTTATVTFGPLWTGGVLCVAAQTPCFTSGTKCITLGNAPLTAYTPTSSSYTICPGTSQTFGVPANAGIASYSWTLPANATGSSATNSINVNFLTGFTGGNICVTATSICGVALTQKCKTINSAIPPVPSSLSGPLTGLCNQTVVYTCPTQGGVIFNWTAPSGTTVNSGQGTNAVSLTFGTFTTGTVCVTATNGCGTSAPRCKTVKGAPNAPGAISAIPSSWCANTSGIEFSADVSTLTGSYTLSWLYPNASVAQYVLGGGNSTILILDWLTGSGPVHVTASNGCGNATRTSTQGNTCRQDDDLNVASGFTIGVYPNPAENNFTVEFMCDKNQSGVLQLTDAAGKVVMHQPIKIEERNNLRDVNVSHLAKGFYVLSVKTENNIIRQKVEVR